MALESVLARDQTCARVETQKCHTCETASGKFSLQPKGRMSRVIQMLAKSACLDNGFPHDVPASHSTKRVKNQIDIDDLCAKQLSDNRVEVL